MLNPTAIIQRRCGAVVDELHAVASDELTDELAAIDAGHALTAANQAKLAAYLRDELADAGMLSREHLRESECPNVSQLRRQAQLLLSLVQDAS